MNTQQIADTLLMVRPANFGFNPETAESNAFQVNEQKLSMEAIKETAKKEFDAFVKKLRAVGVQVIVVEDTAAPIKTDAVFPNNWITFHQNGTIITYPMLSPNRRLERREDVIEMLRAQFDINQHFDFSGSEASGVYLEGTGSLILDRPNKIAYACLSERTNMDLLNQFGKTLGYELVVFNAVDESGLPIYHTNVMMALGETFVVICLDSVRDLQEQETLKTCFSKTNKALITISFDQVLRFAGNMLEVKGKDSNYLVMSQQAFESLETNQIKTIESHTKILYSDIKVIETYGGGSARCMMAEVFLPEKEK